MDKLKAVGLVFLVCLALGAGWALWMGVKVFAWIAIAGLIIGVVATVAWRAKFGGRRLTGSGERSRLS